MSKYCTHKDCKGKDIPATHEIYFYPFNDKSRSPVCGTHVKLWNETKDNVTIYVLGT